MTDSDNQMNREESGSYFEQFERLACEVDKLKQENAALQRKMRLLFMHLSKLTDHVTAQEERKQKLLSIVPAKQQQVPQTTDSVSCEVIHLPSIQPQNRRQSISSTNTRTSEIGMFSANARY